MKIYLAIILILFLSSAGFGQTRYINTAYGFSVLPPANTVVDNNMNTELGYISTYSCNKPMCSTYGYFTVMKIQPLPDTTQAEAVRLFQREWVLANNEKQFLKDADPAMNTTILSNKYIAVNGKPADRIDYNFSAKGMSFNGSVIALFLVEKQIVVAFNYVSLSDGYTEWNNLCESAIKSLLIYPAATPPGPLPQTGKTTSAQAAEDWESKTTSEWEAKEGWKYFAYSGDETNEVLYFLNTKMLRRTGATVQVWVKEVPKNSRFYIEERMRNTTPGQKAALPKIPLNYLHQLYSVNCEKLEYKTIQAELHWSDSSSNLVAVDKNLVLNVSPGSVGEKIVNAACGIKND